MRLLDSRRLTGPSLMHPRPAVIAEVAFDAGEDPERAVARWWSEASRMIAAIGTLGDPQPLVRMYKGGAALAFEAPIDVLLPACDVNEWAIAGATSPSPLPLEPHRSELATGIAANRSPELLALAEAARDRGIPLLLDDKLLTLGMGRKSRSYPRGQGELSPSLVEIPWAELSSLPVALVTGTNGKTTSTRLAARIARHAGVVAGSTSTDGVAIDGKLVESGDYTGPAGALAVLRRSDIDVAILETARGGILRRGLAVASCEAALITNVSCDHLGDYGIDDLEAMARVKAVVATVARTVVLNAADPMLVKLAPSMPAEKVWFAIDPTLGALWTVRDGWIVRGTKELVRIADVPITFDGRARYNVENALGAAALASALGIGDDAIAAGLRSFRSTVEDNPGRANLAQLPSGARVLVDFGHNPAGIERVLAFARALAGSAAITVIAGMPGDRLDDEMREVAREIARANPARVLLRELGGYLRGREPGVIPEILRRGLIDAGLAGDRIELAADEVDALQRALELAHGDELIAILPSIQGEDVRRLLDKRGATW